MLFVLSPLQLRAEGIIQDVHCQHLSVLPRPRTELALCVQIAAFAVLHAVHEVALEHVAVSEVVDPLAMSLIVEPGSLVDIPVLEDHSPCAALLSGAFVSTAHVAELHKGCG